jgi:hypothetical protein
MSADKPLRCDFFVPGFRQLLVCDLRHHSGEGNIGIEYRGTMEELLAAGIATAEMLVVNRPTGPRVKRVDQAGFPFQLVRSWRSCDAHGQECEPYRWFTLRLTRPLARAGELPYAREAIAAMARYRSSRSAAYGEPKPLLRLVEDTRRVH